MKNRNLNLVTSEWLLRNFRTVKIFDASWHMPSTNRSAAEEFKKNKIYNSQFFDIDLISNKKSNLPHMLPDENTFNEYMNKFKVKNSDHVILYDTKGIFSSPRAWYTFKLFGHDEVSVLDGGFPKWLSFIADENIKKKLSNIIDRHNNIDYPEDNSKYVSKLNKELIIDLNYVKNEYITKKDNDKIIIDARSSDRFNSVVDEPRPGLFRGHIPGSLNCPFDKMIKSDGTLKENEEIIDIIKNLGIKGDKKYIHSCGSGLTACVNIFAMNCAGVDLKNLYLYDGSWSEYGLKELKNPIEN